MQRSVQKPVLPPIKDYYSLHISRENWSRYLSTRGGIDIGVYLYVHDSPTDLQHKSVRAIFLPWRASKNVLGIKGEWENLNEIEALAQQLGCDIEMSTSQLQSHNWVTQANLPDTVLLIRAASPYPDYVFKGLVFPIPIWQRLTRLAT